MLHLEAETLGEGMVENSTYLAGCFFFTMLPAWTTRHTGPHNYGVRRVDGRDGMIGVGSERS